MRTMVRFAGLFLATLCCGLLVVCPAQCAEVVPGKPEGNIINSMDCVEKVNGFLRCPEVAESMCDFSRICVRRRVGDPDSAPGVDSEMICEGMVSRNGVFVKANVVEEIRIIMTGAATEVPTFDEPAEGKEGVGLMILDVKSCYVKVQCNCEMEGWTTSKCRKGAETVIQLARYEIDPRITCTKKGIGDGGGLLP